MKKALFGVLCLRGAAFGWLASLGGAEGAPYRAEAVGADGFDWLASLGGAEGATYRVGADGFGCR